MLVGFFSSKSSSLFVRFLHVGKKFTSLGAEDIIFKAVCVNIKQKKWEFLDQLSSSLTVSLFPRVFREFRSSPKLLLEFYQRLGGGKAILFSLESCCILILVMVERRNFHDALFLIKELIISRGHRPLEVLESLITSSDSCFPSTAVFDALVGACTQIGAAEDAFEVIKKSTMGGNRVSISAWNNFLNHLLKMGDIGRFWDMYREMLSYEYYENVNTFNLLIYALCKECKLSEALSVIYRMLKGGILPNIVGFNMVVDGACRAGDLYLASRIVKKMEIMSSGSVSPNAVTYNCLINGYCKNGYPRTAEEIMDKMIEMGLKPNTRTYGTIVDGYSRNGCLEEGFRLCDKMVEKSLIPNSAVYNSVIHWLYMEGDISGASSLLSNMIENHVPPDEFTHSIIIKGLCRNGQVNEALNLHHWIVNNNLVGDTYSHNVLIDYLFRSKDISGAQQLLCSMYVRGLIPDAVTYGTIIDGYCKLNRAGRAIEVYTDMISTNTNPNLVIFNSLLNGLCKDESMPYEALLLDEMKRLDMFDAMSFNTLLNSYCCNGKIEAAFELFLNLRKVGYLVNKVTYNIMINFFCKWGLFEHAKQLLSMMICGGHTPDHVTYTILLTNLSNKRSSEAVIEMHDYLVLRGVIPDRRTYEAIVGPVVKDVSPLQMMSDFL